MANVEMAWQELKVGMTGKAEEQVTEANLAKTLGSGSLPVYGTPAMSCLMERAAAELLSAHMPAGWTTVGISMQIAHKAPSPLGAKIRAEAVITAIEGRKVCFAVRAFAGTQEIGSGTHERFAVGADRFMAKARAASV